MRELRIRFFTVADFEEEEAWLRSMHRRGLRLARTAPPCFFYFEECPPEDVIYRLDFKNNTQSAEYMQMVRDFGWEECGRCLGWLYFRRSADDIPAQEEAELFSDGSSKLEMVRRVILTRMLPLLVIFLCCVIPGFFRSADHTANGLGVFLFGLFTALLAVYVYLIVYCGLKLWRLSRKYRGE